MTEAGQSLIQIQDLTKVFYTDEIETHALSGIHLSVQKGEYVAMSGPSGCGKSTLLSIIGLLDTPTAGRYHLNGKAVENLDFAERLRFAGRTGRAALCPPAWPLLPRGSNACRTRRTPSGLGGGPGRAGRGLEIRCWGPRSHPAQ